MAGRPCIVIDKDQFEELCKMQCTELEICSWFGCSDETLNKWCKKTYKKTFRDTFAEKREGGKISLRRSQWNLAQTNPSMAIFLGKNYLGQCDDPRKYDREETTEDKIDRFIDILSDTLMSNVSDSSDDADSGDTNDE